ncbi:MAG: hypothetical protein NTW28_23660 [Candidatus Solibacter sp.]|nr:hypothetical protein [Candidatus Solibacter sp.]
MKKLNWTYVPIFVIFALSMTAVAILRAQAQGSITRITPVPEGPEYSVDGQPYTRASSAAWPEGSKHTLWVPYATQMGHVRTRYVFRGWEFAGGPIPFNPVTVTASPSISEYRALFDVLYGLGVALFNCPDPTHCDSPGTISVDGALYNSTEDVYMPANSTVVLQAFPKPGYVFLGWLPGTNQAITGFQNTVTLTGPLTVYPRFQVARKVNLTTDPPELVLLADRAPVPTPSALDWAIDSVHTVGANSPQRDKFGKIWVFQSWSDGGELDHAYTVASSSTPASLTAKYVAAAGVAILTLPVGLQIKVDGQYNALNPYYFAWGAGEKHHLEAPAQQTDAQGRVWQFSSWSNGGKATQDIVVPEDAAANGLRLTATYTPLTKLTVNSSLSGLSVKLDGVECTTPCETLRDVGTQVRVSAPASVSQGDGARSDFDGWPGTPGDLVVTLGDAAVTVNANYHLFNRLSAASDPVNGAVWTVLPASADGFYRANSNVALSLTAQPGYRFRRWDGDLSGTIPSGVVTMSAPRVVKALLDPVPYIAPAGVGNAAGTTPQTGMAPGGIISIFGVNLATETVVAPDGMLPQTLGGLTVRVGDRILPLFFVSPQQINAQLPDDLATGNQVLTISPAGAAEVRAPFTVVRNAPGLFPVTVNGQAMAMAVHENGSPVTADAPARPGELLTVYGTGFGPAERTRPEGFPIPQTPAYSLADGVTVQVGEVATPAEKAFAVAGRCGIDAVQFRLDSAATGTATLRITVNGADSNTLLLPVR